MDYGFLHGADLSSADPSLMDRLKRGVNLLGHEFNTGLGAAYGMLSTGSLPTHGPDGELRFVDEDGQGSPVAMGDSVYYPNPESVTPRNITHEGVHRGQSRDRGWGYLFGDKNRDELEAYTEELNQHGRPETTSRPPTMMRDIGGEMMELPDTVKRAAWDKENPDYNEWEASRAAKQHFWDQIYGGR